MSYDNAVRYDPRAFWSRVNETRLKRRMTWTDVQWQSDVSRRSFEQYKAGNRFPTALSIQKIAEGLRIPTDELVAGIPQIEKAPPASRKTAKSPENELDRGAMADLEPCSSDIFQPRVPAIGARLVGRRALQQILCTALEDARSVSLVGDRRIGKSSALKEWERRTRALGRVVVWLSGELSEGQSPQSFVEAATKASAPDDPDGAAEALMQWAKTVVPPDLPPVLLVDEFDGMASRLPDRFLERLRGMVGERRIILVLSTCRDLDCIYEEAHRTSPFYNLLETARVALLEPDAADLLCLRGEASLGEEGVALIRRWSGRHPFYIQLLGDYLVTARLRGEGTDAALERFQDEAARHMRDLWRTLNPREQEELRIAVKSGTAPSHRSLRIRGILTESGAPFGHVLVDWIQEEV